MQPRTLDQILSSLSSVYEPQLASVRQRQTEIPGQIAAEETALKAKEQDYYDNTILGGARRRGLGFSGIPEGERARYGAVEYLPALARLRQSGREQALSLEDAILGINERRTQQAQGIYDSERNFYEQQRQFNESQRLAREQMAAQQRAAAASSFSPSITAPAATQSAAGGGGVDQGRAQAAVLGLLNTKNKNTILKTYDAIRKSAGYGNTYDKYKLQLINSIPEFQQYLISNYADLRF